jgi:hypothetical protein
MKGGAAKQLTGKDQTAFKAAAVRAGRVMIFVNSQVAGAEVPRRQGVQEGHQERREGFEVKRGLHKEKQSHACLSATTPTMGKPCASRV